MQWQEFILITKIQSRQPNSQLRGPSVHQGGEPKFEIKHKNCCFQKSKLFDWGPNMSIGDQTPPGPLGADSAKILVFVQDGLGRPWPPCPPHPWLRLRPLPTIFRHHDYKSLKKIFFLGYKAVVVIAYCTYCESQ